VAGGRVIERLAMTIVDVAAVFDPERIVLDGSIGQALEPYLPRLVDLVAPVALYPPEICVSHTGPERRPGRRCPRGLAPGRR
jgi:glucokinase